MFRLILSNIWAVIALRPHFVWNKMVTPPPFGFGLEVTPVQRRSSFRDAKNENYRFWSCSIGFPNFSANMSLWNELSHGFPIVVLVTEYPPIRAQCIRNTSELIITYIWSFCVAFLKILVQFHHKKVWVYPDHVQDYFFLHRFFFSYWYNFYLVQQGKLWVLDFYTVP